MSKLYYEVMIPSMNSTDGVMRRIKRKLVFEVTEVSRNNRLVEIQPVAGSGKIFVREDKLKTE